MSGGGAGTQQGAQYYNGVDAAFGGVLVALVAEPAASWKLSADLPDSVVLRLRWAVCGKPSHIRCCHEEPTEDWTDCSHHNHETESSQCGSINAFVCVGLRGVAAAASEAPTAVSVYRERLSPVLLHLPGLLGTHKEKTLIRKLCLFLSAMRL
jgi:hypothetical protein